MTGEFRFYGGTLGHWGDTGTLGHCEGDGKPTQGFSCRLHQLRGHKIFALSPNIPSHQKNYKQIVALKQETMDWIAFQKVRSWKLAPCFAFHKLFLSQKLFRFKNRNLRKTPAGPDSCQMLNCGSRRGNLPHYLFRRQKPDPSRR